MSQLSSHDVGFLYAENDTFKTHATLLAIYDQSELKQPLRYRDILGYFDSRIAGMPVFRRKLFRVPLELDAPYLADDPHFNIESHVRHIALPKPGDWRQFCILAAQIQAVPVDMSKPLWDMHIIEGLDHLEGVAPGSFAILTRLHHTIADGSTGRGILMAMHHPKGQAPQVLPKALPEAPPSLAHMALQGALNNARQYSAFPGRVAKLVPVFGPALGQMAISAVGKLFASDDAHHELDQLRDGKVPDTVFNGDMEYRRVFQLQRYPLDSIKRMRVLAPGNTLNDVVLTLIGGGVRRYFAATGEKQDVDLTALCPVNLREDKQDNSSLQGNNISLMRINLNTRIAHPAKRLAKIVAATGAAKLAQKASSAQDIIALSRNAPNLLLTLGMRVAVKRAFRDGHPVLLSNCMITNVPGPQEPLYFMGARLELFTGVAPVSPGSGVSFCVTSYNGQLCISLTACPGWVKDPQLLIRCMDDSFAEMLAAAETTAPASKATTVRKTPSRQRQLASKATSGPKAKLAVRRVAVKRPSAKAN